MEIKKIIVVTRCLRIGKEKTIFHFKGHVFGQKIQYIEIFILGENHFKVGEDYLMTITEVKIDEGKLKGNLASSTKLEDILFTL